MYSFYYHIHTSYHICAYRKYVYKYIGGSRGRAGTRPPLQDPILSFVHTSSPKSALVVVGPPTGQRPPLREILDPSLKYHSNLH